MKSLSTIQALAKAAKIISAILFVCAIVGLCLCGAGILSLAFGVVSFQLGNTTVQGILPDVASVSDGTLYADLAQGMIACLVVIVLTAFAKHYFKQELADGNPFSHDGAQELMRLGILGTILPLVGELAAELVCALLKQMLPDVAADELNTAGWAAIGLAIIVMACLCEYGADLREGKRSFSKARLKKHKKAMRNEDFGKDLSMEDPLTQDPSVES